jgi:hypothetical protein
MRGTNKTTSNATLSVNPHSVKRRQQAAKMPTWRAQLAKSLSYHRGRRAYNRKQHEIGKMSEEVFATRNVNSIRRVCDEHRRILEAVPVAERDAIWREKHAWEKDTRA